MLILTAEADEALVGTAVDRIAKVVSTGGGEVGKIDRWGRRRFAYEIEKQTEGYYVVVRFTAEPTAQTELDRAMHLADEVIRHKILVLPEGLDAANAQRAADAAARSAARAARAAQAAPAASPTEEPTPASPAAEGPTAAAPAAEPATGQDTGEASADVDAALDQDEASSPAPA
jgi:small subunit ribosomal protein S6